MGTLRLFNNGLSPFSSFFNDSVNDEWITKPLYYNQSYLPAVNIKETENEYIIDVSAPGYTKDSFKINLENNILTISSEKEKTKEEKNDKELFTRKEFSYHSFSRSFSLPDREIDGEKIEAKYENGILTVSLPKHEETKPKPARKIAIA